MCGIAEATLAITAATAIASAAGQVVQVQQQRAANDVAEDVAERNFVTERSSIQLRQEAAAASAANVRTANTIEARRAAGLARAAFAGANVGGGALGAVERDFARQEGRASAAELQRLRFSGFDSRIAQQAAFQRTVVGTHLRRGSERIDPFALSGTVLRGLGEGLSIVRSERLRRDDADLIND